MHQVSRHAAWTLFALVSTVAPSAVAATQYVNGYAVSAHRSCGANNLPGTVTELQRFFASANFPAEAAKNVFRTNTQVKATDWAAATDYRQASGTPNGHDGADSALIAYIASHGSTSSARYTALAGGGAAGCNIRSSAMGLGDQTSRYLVLSTCQGLKIGNGDDPTRAGENPSRTWAGASTGNAGLNCIFGYSNNMVDSDKYGVNLLNNLATSDETLTQAFLRASRQISYSNIPAVLCFGQDGNDAQNRLETVKRFSDERFGKGGSAWTYAQARKISNVYHLPRDKVLRNVASSVKTIDATKLARALLGSSVTDTGAKGDLAVYRSTQGIMTYDAQSGTVAWQSGRSWTKGKPFALKDERVVAIAREFLQSKGVARDPEHELYTTYVIDQAVSRGETQELVSKTVVLHQRVHGLAPLGTAGSVEVTVDADGRVTGLTSTVLNFDLPRIPEWVETGRIDTGVHVRTALERVQRRLPDARLTVVEARVGYGEAAADGTGRSEVVVEVLVEADAGGYARRYAERLPL